MRRAIALLRYSSGAGNALARRGFPGMMEVHGFVSAEERAILDDEPDLRDRRLVVFRGDAGSDLPKANLLVEQALDRGTTLLVTLARPVTQIAVKLPADMEEPVPAIFSIVSAPYSAGIAEPPRIKLDHLARTKIDGGRDLTMRPVLAQNPNPCTIGMMVNAARALGLAVETVSIVAAADWPVATAAVVDQGVDAIFLTGDTDSSGLPAILDPALEAGSP